MHNTKKSADRLDVYDWIKGWAITAVLLDHFRIFPEPYVVWSVNLFVLVTMGVYSRPQYGMTAGKLFMKVFHLLFLYYLSIAFFDAVFTLGRYAIDKPIAAFLFNPVYMFVKNPYLGHIWYLALHLQMLFILYFFLKHRDKIKPVWVIMCSVAVSSAAFYLTHFYLNKMHTILVFSWFLYMATGFYGVRPFLARIAGASRFRGLRLCLAVALILLVYSCLPRFPEFFTTDNRAVFFTFPLYFAVLFFLGELFYLLRDSGKANPVINFMNFLGRHTLVIYMTHSAFASMWRPAGFSQAVLMVLATVSAVLFGELAGRLFPWAAALARHAAVLLRLLPAPKAPPSS